MLDARIVGSVIHRFREKKNMSQELASGLAGIGRTHLSAIERGQRKPTLETFCRIAEAIQMKPSELLRKLKRKRKRPTHKQEKSGGDRPCRFVCYIRRASLLLPPSRKW